MNNKQEILNELLEVARSQCGCEAYDFNSNSILGEYNSKSLGKITVDLENQSNFYGIAEKWMPNPAPLCSIIHGLIRVRTVQYQPPLKTTASKENLLGRIIPFFAKNKTQFQSQPNQVSYRDATCSEYISNAKNDVAFFMIFTFSVNSSNQNDVSRTPAQICLVMSRGIYNWLLKVFTNNTWIVHPFITSLFADVRDATRANYLSRIKPFTGVCIHEISKLRLNTGTARPLEDGKYLITAGMKVIPVSQKVTDVEQFRVRTAEEVLRQESKAYAEQVLEPIPIINQETVELERISTIINSCINPIVDAHSKYQELLLSLTLNFPQIQTRILGESQSDAESAMTSLTDMVATLKISQNDLEKRHKQLLQMLPKTCQSFSQTITLLEKNADMHSKEGNEELAILQKVISTLQTLDKQQNDVTSSSETFDLAHEQLQIAFSQRSNKEKIKTATNTEASAISKTTNMENLASATAKELSKIAKQAETLGRELSKINKDVVKKVELAKSLEDSVNSLRKYLRLTQLPAILADTVPKSATQVEKDVIAIQTVEISFTTKTTFKDLLNMCQKQLRALNTLVKRKNSCGQSSVKFFEAMEKAQTHFKALNDQIKSAMK